MRIGRCNGGIFPAGDITAAASHDRFDGEGAVHPPAVDGGRGGRSSRAIKQFLKPGDHLGTAELIEAAEKQGLNIGGDVGLGLVNRMDTGAVNSNEDTPTAPGATGMMGNDRLWSEVPSWQRKKDFQMSRQAAQNTVTGEWG